MQQHEAITAKHHIICEGPDDMAFFDRLIAARNIPDFQVNCGRKPNDPSDKRCLGTSGFIHRLNALKAVHSTMPQSGFVIATDSDDDPNVRFAYACARLQEAGLPVPARPYEIATAPNNISSAVMIIPRADRQGGLETILLDCCAGLMNDMTACADAYCHCAGTAAWPEKDQHKIRLRAIIAATNQDDPSLGISMWLSSARRPFNFNNAALDTISQFLMEFSAV